MTELQRPEPQPPQETGYQTYIRKRIEGMRANPELQGVYSWYKERTDGMSEMNITTGPLTDGDKWKHTKTPEGEVQEIRSGFFSIEGRTISTSNHTWTQPGIISSETTVSLPTPEGVQNIETSGFVGLIRDAKGNILLSIAQEALAQTPKKAVVKTPFQTSAAKLQGILNGQKELDVNLAALLEKIGKGKSAQEMFASGEIKTLPLGPADANRMQTTNIGFLMTVSNDEIRETLTSDGKNRWCTPLEVKALVDAGVINGLTASILLATL